MSEQKLDEIIKVLKETKQQIGCIMWFLIGPTVIVLVGIILLTLSGFFSSLKHFF